MADFSALKTSIQNYIKQNGNEEITGNLLQQVLLSMVTTLGDSAINDLVTALNNEVSARQNADETLQGNINTLQGNINTLQRVVNGIKANIDNGYVYAGIANPSTTPASGKVFYLALTAGTYTNFGATVVPQGINILKYNGSAWSLDSFLGLDNAPTQGSNNLVKSGGVLDSIIKDGSAFDLSAYNSGTTYADLSAALTALNALPAAYKKGGMSMKFVQSSDNNYVKFFCTAQNFTTDVTQWQGVDEEPTTGSKNLVESGGVAPIKLEVDGGTIILGSNTAAPAWSGKYIDTSGNIVTGTNQYKLTNPIFLHAGDKLKVVEQYTSAYATIIRCDVDLTTIYERKTGANASFTATEDCYVAAHINTGGTYTISQIYQGLLTSVGSLPTLNTTEKTNLVGAINEVNTQAQTNKDDITNLGLKVDGGNIIIGTKDNPPSLSNKRIDASGNIVTADNYNVLTNPIFLEAGDKITFTQQYAPQYAAIIRCDAELTTIYERKQGANASLTAANDCYVACHINKGSNTYTITKTVKGLVQDIGNLTALNTTEKTNLVGAINEVKGETTELKKSVPQSKALIQGTDYHRTTGHYIGSTGSVLDGGWMSEPIPVKSGDIFKISTNYNNGTPAIVKTDADQSFYLPILTSIFKNREYTVPVDYDGYILLSCSSTDIAYTITKTSLPNDEHDIVIASDKSDKQITLDDVESRISDLYAQKRKYQAEQNTAVIKARFDREVMLAEVHAMTEDDVLASGSCGYVVNNDDVTDVTDGTMTWKIYKNGILYISGYGRMYDFVKGTSACSTINSVNTATTHMMDFDPYMWYYGFVPQNLNNITPPTPPDGYRYRENGNVMVYANKRYVPWGDNINTFIRDTCGFPSYNKVYGYSAPWFIYRTEIDDSYDSDAEYNQRNPTKIRYNRICIEEDTQHGGITYIGDWAFYRASADSLILPDAVTMIGCWSIRYSPVLRTLSMGNNVTDIEDHGISRMEALEYCKLSSSLQNINEYSISPYYTKYLSLPSTLVNYADYATYGCNGLECVEFAGSESNPSQIANIGSYAFTLGALSIVDIPEYIAATAIKDNAFYNLKALQIRIPQNITTIENDAFYGNQLAKVIIDSSTVAGGVDNITPAIFGYLLANTQVVAIKQGLTVGGYINRRFTYFKTVDGYDIYMRYTYSGEITYEVIS